MTSDTLEQAGERPDDQSDERPGQQPDQPDSAQAAPVLDLERSPEAIFMVADEPQTLVSLATALNAPIPAVRQSIERLVADYDGETGTRRGFELREVGGGWRIYVREEFDDAVRIVKTCEVDPETAEGIIDIAKLYYLTNDQYQ